MKRQFIYLGYKLRNNLNKLLKMNIFNERTMDLRLLLVTLATKSLPHRGEGYCWGHGKCGIMKERERQEVHHSAEMVAQDPNHQRSEMIGTEEEVCRGSGCTMAGREEGA